MVRCDVQTGVYRNFDGVYHRVLCSANGALYISSSSQRALRPTLDGNNQGSSWSIVLCPFSLMLLRIGHSFDSHILLRVARVGVVAAVTCPLGHCIDSRCPLFPSPSIQSPRLVSCNNGIRNRKFLFLTTCMCVEGTHSATTN